MEFETPHTDWAQPYALGKIRALFFSDGRGTAPREMVELMQRFDIEADAVYRIRVIDSSDYEFLGGDAGHRRILRLLERPYDVYIFQGVPLTLLTAEEQYKLLKPVTEGAGLVLIGMSDKRVLKPERQLETLPPFLAGQPGVEAFTIRSGRGIRMPPRPEIDYHVGWEVEYDYWQERLGRAVLWAAGREPEMQLSVSVEPAEADRGDLGAVAAVVRWSEGNAPRLTIEPTLRRWDGERILLKPLTPGTTEGAGGVEMPPLLRAGQYHMDVRARSKRGIEAWATTGIAVTSPRTVEAVELDKDWGEIGEAVSGHVRLAGDPAPGEMLRVRLMGRRGRVLARQDMNVTAEVVPFRLPIDAWMPMLLRVEAVRRDGEQEVASGYAYCRVTHRHRGQFNFLVWDFPSGTLAPYGEASLARLGTTIHLSGNPNPPLQLAAYDIAYVPYTTRIMAPKDENGVMKPVCWNDEPAVQKYVDGIVEKYAPARAHGVFVYSLGDETVTRGSCVHPACLAAYCRYLEQEYGDIAALNASWGTNFASFDAVTLSQPGDDDERAALLAKNYPRWYDREAFKCYNFVQFCKRFGEAYREIDPLARTGFEGAGRFRNGDDIDLIVRTNGFWSPYPGSADEIIRSIAPRDFPRANWMGYTKDADSLLSKYWRMITRGTDAVWWWRWDALGRFNGFLAPHLGPFPATKDLAEDTKVVRDGLGTLLINSEMLDDGIALLYSMPSVYAARLEGGPSYGSCENQHTAWYSAIRDLGLQFRYVTDRMLRLREFDARRYKALILPQAEAIGPEEAGVIRAFAEGGGTVIADIRPGLFDGHCKPLARGCLDDMFGIEREGNQEAVTGSGAISLAQEPPAEPIALSWEDAKVDPAVRLVDGEAWGTCGETAVCIVHKVGRGQAVLLNFAMASFPNIATEAAPEEAATVLRALFTLAGIEPRVELASGEERLRNIEVVRWRNRDIEFMALFRENGEGGQVRVTLPEERYVYDLRRHDALGPVTSFQTRIIPCRATFFALLPDAAPPVKLEVPRQASPGEVVTARLSVPKAAGLHALRIRAQTPDGGAADWWDQVVIVGRDPVEVRLPVAFNDPQGQWRVRAVDLYTERAVGRELRVAER
jgi:beta-galactosidase